MGSRRVRRHPEHSAAVDRHLEPGYPALQQVYDVTSWCTDDDSNVMTWHVSRSDASDACNVWSISPITVASASEMLFGPCPWRRFSLTTTKYHCEIASIFNYPKLQQSTKAERGRGIEGLESQQELSPVYPPPVFRDVIIMLVSCKINKNCCSHRCRSQKSMSAPKNAKLSKVHWSATSIILFLVHVTAARTKILTANSQQTSSSIMMAIAAGYLWVFTSALAALTSP